MIELIIPDVHEMTATADHIVRSNSHDHATFLGDYLDNWGDSPDDIKRTTGWLNRLLERPNTTVLLGNHDCPYIWPEVFRQDGDWGMNDEKLLAFTRNFHRPYMDRFKFMAKAGTWFLSHAGITKQHLSDPLPLTATNACDWINAGLVADLNAGLFPRLMRCGDGRRRKPVGIVGGIIWCDWALEFMPSDGIHQIVGHTRGKSVRANNTPTSRNFCIDTDLRYAIKVNTDTDDTEIIEC